MHRTILLTYNQKRGLSLRDELSYNFVNADLHMLNDPVVEDIRAGAQVVFVVLANKSEQLLEIIEKTEGLPKVLMWEGEEIDDLIAMKFNRVFVYPFVYANVAVYVRNLRYMFDYGFETEYLQFADLSLDLKQRQLNIEGSLVPLSNKEFSLLELFMKNPHKALTRVEILERVWDRNSNLFTNTVDVHIGKLRKKLKEKGKDDYIKTLHGFGYLLGEVRYQRQSLF